MINLAAFLLLISSSFASEYVPRSSASSFESAPEYQAILSELKTYGDFAAKVDAPAPIKTLSKGEQAVEEAKARNRAELARMYEAEKASAPVTEKGNDLAAWKKQERETLAQWKKETQELLDQWKREQEIFLGRLKVYKENTFVLPVKPVKVKEKPLPVTAVPEAHMVSSAFKLPVRDQKDRPTCSAFAGLRAVEIILAQNNKELDLSEQYFYWSSKPNCQSSPCEEKGSWVTPGFKHSQLASKVDVPLENDCAYSASAISNNETQVPLSEGCRSGSAKIVSYEDVKTLESALGYLKRDIPVILGAYLSENFYRNRGLVFLEGSEASKRSDGHAKGHTLLAVGVLELPEKLRAREGSYCLMTVNSWGKGWGAGGYACLTEKWLLKYRQGTPMVAVTKVSTQD